MTLFDVIALFTCIVGARYGWTFGGHYFGAAGGIVGIILGGYTGLIVGRLPYVLSLRWALHSLHRKSSEDLRQIVHSGQFYRFHLVIAELMARGEDIQPERTYVFDLLSADTRAERMFGWRTLQFAFPEMAAKISDYDPNAATEVCRSKAQQIKVD